MQVESPDVCHVLEGWCASHDRKAGHVEIEQLGRLRAESAAIGGLRGAAQVFMVRGRCLQCDGPVSRRVDEQGDYAAVLPWAHDEPGRDSQHTVTGVLPTA